MAKRNLSALLDTSITGTEPGEEDAPAAVQPGETDPTPNHPDAPGTPPETPPSELTPPAGSTRGTPPRRRTTTGPRYLELDRKELRIRGDQADDLTALSRQLNRARKSTGDRITDNTLIRVAIDLLMRDRDKLEGATEADLLKSVLPE